MAHLLISSLYFDTEVGAREGRYAYQRIPPRTGGRLCTLAVLLAVQQLQEWLILCLFAASNDCRFHST